MLGVKRMPRPLSESRKPESRRKTSVCAGHAPATNRFTPRLPRTALRIAGEGAERSEAGEGRLHLTLIHHSNEVFHLVDHTPDRGRVFENAPAMPLVQPETLERCFLVRLAPDRTSELLDRDRPLALHQAFSRGSVSRRPRISPTFLPRRAATARGLVARPKATKVALIMLCGFGLPIDLATTSCTPSASKIARIGPPAMIPVPALAARTTTWPAP